jgi:hypothetical protein
MNPEKNGRHQKHSSGSISELLKTTILSKSGLPKFQTAYADIEDRKRRILNLILKR